MPGMDGYETTVAIRSSGVSSSHLPIIAVSADVMPEQVRRCLETGLDDHLAKPISPATLLKIVDRYVAHPEAPARSAPGAHAHAI